MTERMKMKWKFVTSSDGNVSIEADPEWRYANRGGCSYSRNSNGGMKQEYVSWEGGLISEEALDRLTTPWTEE